MIDQKELLNNYPTAEEIKQYNSIKDNNIDKKNLWWKKPVLKGLVVLTLATGTITTYELANPQVVEASVIEKDVEKEYLSKIEEHYKDATYDDIKVKYDEVKDEIKEITDVKIPNEVKIIDGKGYNLLQKAYAKQVKKGLENKKKILLKMQSAFNELLIIKGSGYTDKAKETSKKALVNIQKEIFAQKGSIAIEYGIDTVKWTLEKIGQGIDIILDQID